MNISDFPAPTPLTPPPCKCGSRSLPTPGNEYDFCERCNGRVEAIPARNLPRSPAKVAISPVAASIQPGARVKHAMHHADHDKWRGFVTEVVDTHRVGSRTRDIYVRWIRPDGDPSDGTTRCSESELVLVTPPSPTELVAANTEAGRKMFETFLQTTAAAKDGAIISNPFPVPTSVVATAIDGDRAAIQQVIRSVQP